MARAVSIGAQDFEMLITNNCFYVDKTLFIKEWWESYDIVIILLDEYDTPMQEAYINGYWEELVSFTRALFNSTFKANPYLERAVMTGIMNLSGAKFAKQTSNGSALAEAMFSDLNNLKVVTMSSDKYASCFGFTEKEVFAAMDEYNMTNKSEVKEWYDGFTIGSVQDIYNPWSIINFLDEGKLKLYWANTSSNGLISRLVQKGNAELKVQFERLLQRQSIITELDEEIVFNQLEQDPDAIWSLLLASGYLTVMQINEDNYELVLTNYEVEKMFYKMVKNWFGKDRMALSMFSSFDGGNHPSEETDPESFYHGFVLGLLVDLAGKYQVTSNRESGFGRYDVMLAPLDKESDGMILEFKVYDPEEEGSLEDTIQSALHQIEEKKYEQSLLDGGVPKERIRKYGFAFEGKKVLIG